MQSTGHDARFGGGADAGLPAHVVDIVVLSTDGGLLATLRDACGPQHALWHAPSADAAVDYLVGGRCGILIADLDALRGDVAALFERLHAQFPELVLIASGRRNDEHAVGAQMSSGRVYRFLHKPLSPARAALFVSGATRRYAELRHVEPLMLTTVKAIAARRNWGAIAATGVAALGAVFLLIVWRSSIRESNAPATSSYAQSTSHQVADALGRAQVAYLSGRLSDPKGDNALEYFQSVLAIQPDHADARAGIERVLGAMEARVAEALQSGNTAQGAIALAKLQRAQPDHARLDELRMQLLALSRGAGRSETAQSPAQKRTATAAASLPANLQAARERIAEERLTEPAGDNALMYLLRARAAGESASLIKITATDLGQRLLDKAAQAISVSDDVQAQRWVDAAAQLDREFAVALPNLTDIGERATALAQALRQEAIAEQVASVTQLRERGQLIEPIQDNAFDRMLALRQIAADSDAFRAEQQRVVFALLESTRTALAAGDLDNAEAYVTRADILVPGMSTTRTLIEQIARAREESAQ